MTQRVSEDYGDLGVDVDADIGDSISSVAEDRAIAIATARRSRHDSELLYARVESATAEAEAARQLAVNALAEADGLRQAMRTRATIEMAKGILIALRGVDPDTAFEILRGESQRSHQKVSDVATRIVNAAIKPSSSVPPG